MEKPIEEGCRAIFKHSSGQLDGVNNGKKIIVGKFIGRVTGFPRRDYWETDVLIERAGIVERAYVCSEIHLKRLDDYNGDELTTWESMSDIWQPSKVGA